MKTRKILFTVLILTVFRTIYAQDEVKYIGTNGYSIKYFSINSLLSGVPIESIFKFLPDRNVSEKKLIVNSDISSSRDITANRDIYAKDDLFVSDWLLTERVRVADKIDVESGAKIDLKGSATINIASGGAIHNHGFFRTAPGASYDGWEDMILRPGRGVSNKDYISFRNHEDGEMARLHDGQLRLNTINGTGGQIHTASGLTLRPDIDNNGGDDFVAFANTNGDVKTKIQDGAIYTDRVVLNVSSFPDYVFDKNYKLMPLSQVDNYIKEHKHLPNMPSEKEVITNGMDVKQINTVLVEKIEELTLHTIAQEKDIKNLNKSLNELKLFVKQNFTKRN